MILVMVVMMMMMKLKLLLCDRRQSMSTRQFPRWLEMSSQWKRWQGELGGNTLLDIAWKDIFIKCLKIIFFTLTLIAKFWFSACDFLNILGGMFGLKISPQQEVKGGILYNLVLLKHFLWSSFPRQCLFSSTKRWFTQVPGDIDEEDPESGFQTIKRRNIILLKKEMMIMMKLAKKDQGNNIASTIWPSGQ